MRELSLFSGAGGGLLATQHLLGLETISYVEIDEYCQAVLAQRIADGFLDPAPIFGDIRKFISEGYAEAYQGMVDVITAGFPCQPFSVAGKQWGADDERNMWPETAKTISIINPKFVLLENVPGIRRYMPMVVRDLRRIGYEVRRPVIISADDVGAYHKRKRLFVLAYTKQGGLEINSKKLRNHRFSPPRTLQHDCYEGILQKDGRIWPSQSMFRRMVNVIPHWVDRIKATGEAQVPAVVELAWKVLSGELN